MPIDAIATTVLQIQLSDPGSERRLEWDTTTLKRDLEELRVKVSVPAEASESDGRGVDLAVLGGLLVTLQPTIELLTKITELVTAWKKANPAGRKVRLSHGKKSIEIEGATDEDIKKVLELFGGKK